MLPRSIESTLAHERIADHDWATRTQARRAIAEFIDVWSHRERRHSSLDYISPVACEQQRFVHSARAA